MALLRVCLYVFVVVHTGDADGVFRLVARSPRVYFARNFIANVTAAEVDSLFQALDSRMQVSTLGGDIVNAHTRKSRSVYLRLEEVRAHRIPRVIRAKLPLEIKMGLTHFESLQLQSYEGERGDASPGYYLPHTDDLGRIATLIVYLSEHGDNGGGETFFPFLNKEGWHRPSRRDHWDDWESRYCSGRGKQADVLRFQPKRGDAVLFFHHDPQDQAPDDGSDISATHGACPIVPGHGDGIRRVAQQWVVPRWFAPNQDDSAEVLLKGSISQSYVDLSHRALNLTWHDAGTSTCSSNNTCESSKPASHARSQKGWKCARLEHGLATRLWLSRGFAISFLATCAAHSGKTSVQLRLGGGLITWEVEITYGVQKKACEIRATLPQRIKFDKGVWKADMENTKARQMNVDGMPQQIILTAGPLSRSKAWLHFGERKKDVKYMPWPRSKTLDADNLARAWDEQFSEGGDAELCFFHRNHHELRQIYIFSRELKQDEIDWIRTISPQDDSVLGP